MHFSILLCHASMHCWKDSSGMPLSSVITCSPLEGLHTFKTGPLDDPHELGEKKKVTQSKIRWTGRLLQYGDVLLGQELPDAQGIVSRGIVVVKQPQSVLPQLSYSHTLSKAKAAESLCRLADWSSGPVARTHCGILWHRRMWSTWLWLLILTVLLSLASAMSETSALAFGFQVILKIHVSPPVMTTKQVWFSLKTLDDVLTHLQAALLLIIINQSWAIFAKTFRMRGGVNKSMWKPNSMVAES